MKLWGRRGPRSEIDNLYGPVEATVWATRHRCDFSSDEQIQIPIGQPLSEVQYQLQDQELILKGPQVAAGYLSQTGFNDFRGFYSTGDLVQEKRTSLYSFGRKDHPVKLRGQRVELEAIEALVFQTTGQPSVAVVDSNQNLCLVLSNATNLSQTWQTLKAGLPPSHLPRFFFLCQNWPRTASGKINRSDLLQQIESKHLSPLSWQQDPT